MSVLRTVGDVQSDHLLVVVAVQNKLWKVRKCIFRFFVSRYTSLSISSAFCVLYTLVLVQKMVAFYLKN